MNFDSLSSLARTHDLYSLQDKGSGAVQGFALVKRGQIIQSEQLDFVPVGDTAPVVENKQVPPVDEDNKKNSSHMDSVSPDKQSTYNILKESSKGGPDLNTQCFQSILNLSETSTSSNNETTLDECQSQASCTSPLFMMSKVSPTVSELLEDSSEMKAPISLSLSTITSSATTDNAELRSPRLSPHIVVKTEGIFKQPQSESVKLIPAIEEPNPSHHNSNGPHSSTMIASLAAEVISQIKSKLKGPTDSNKNVEKYEMSTKSMKEKESSRFESRKVDKGILDSFDKRRNAKQEMSTEAFSLLSKPFQFGWKRECLVHGSEEVTQVYYQSPTHYTGKGRRFLSRTNIGQYLAEVGETDLTPENFSVRKIFYGFEPAFETVKYSLRYTGGYNAASASISVAKTGWKYDNFFDIVSRGDDSGKRIKCLFCASVFSSKGNFGRHMKVHHEPDETCEKCGLKFRPLKFQDHRARCLELVKNKNEYEVKGQEEDSGISNEIAANSMQNKQKFKTSISASSINSDVPKPVAVKSLPPSIIKSTDAPRPTFENPLVTAIEENPGTLIAKSTTSTRLLKPLDHSFVNRIPVRPGSVSEEVPKIVSCNDGSDQMAILAMTSMEGTRVKMQVKVHAKVVKGMKKFGLRVGVSHTELRFLLDGVELTGEELAGELDGANILVERRDC
eukprot:GFUD01037279.1.p1 GENE.GFUD01037279.1~~GFUD01037279.1.p1  ORF type:complete len:675 (-),score=161.47 GFUD01037279.1:73-2097(-)